MAPDHRVLLADVGRAGAETERFTKGIDGNAYARDPPTQAAVERKFEIIGEALNRLGKPHPDLIERIPVHRRISDRRNILIRGYASVIPKRVWAYP